MKFGLLFVAATVQAAEPSGITRCRSGAADILGTRKAFTVQVCNLFGATCWMNHPSVDAANCGTEALEIAAGTCKLYPIFEFADNGARTAGSATEHMSTESDLGCAVSSSNAVYKWSGSCVSVQCDLGSASFAGPGMTRTGNGNSRTTGVSDTGTATFVENTLASLPAGAKQLKNVFLTRTAGYVATHSIAKSGNSNSVSYTVGNLPTSDGNNYGPVACPSTNNLLTSSKATGITAENLRMCGATGKWVYYNAINLLKDASLYAKYSGNTGSTADLNINSVPFLAGKSAYRSSTAMDDPRAVKLLSDSKSSSAVLMTSGTITPNAVGAANGQTAGTWRSYGVVFYCDDYARTDLTACAAANQKMFYVGDPNPNAQFGTSETAVGGGAQGGGGGGGQGSAATQAPGGGGGATTTLVGASGALPVVPGKGVFMVAAVVTGYLTMLL